MRMRKFRRQRAAWIRVGTPVSEAFQLEAGTLWVMNTGV